MTQLKGKVESDTTLAQVASLSKRYHPYGEQPRDSRRPTQGLTKQFFRKALLEELGTGRANRPNSSTDEDQVPITAPKPCPHSTARLNRGNPSQSSSTSPLFLDLQLDFWIVTKYATKPVGGRTSSSQKTG